MKPSEQIELVVKVPFGFYKALKDTKCVYGNNTAYYAIQNGIPLPKGSTQAFSDEVDDYLERLDKYSDVCNDCAYTIATTVRDMAEKYIIESEEEGAYDDSKGID